MDQRIFLLLLLVPLLINGQELAEARDRGAPVPVIANKNSFRVATLNNSFQPFASLKSSCIGVNPREDENCRGNNRYEGFCVDLLQAVRDEMNRKPEFLFIERQENFTGERGGNGRYNGMIGQLQRGEVDLACGPISNNQELASTLEFSQPIVNSSVSIMMRRPGHHDWCISSFFLPFSWPMWLTLFLIFGLLLLARFLLLLFKKKLRRSPPFSNHRQGMQHEQRVHHEIHHPEDGRDGHAHHPDDYNPTEHQNFRKVQLVKNIRRLLKYLLYGLSLFTLVFYLASLTSILVNRQRQIHAVRSLSDLTSQENMRYGMIRNGEVHNFFRQSPNPEHQQILRNVETQTPSGFVSNYQEGIDRAREEDGNYAFLVESTANDFANRQDCTTYQAGPNFAPLNYGLAMARGSPWRPEVDQAIQTLRNNGRLEELRSTWWDSNSACPSIEDSQRLGWSSGLCGLIFLFLLLLLLGLLYTLLRHFMEGRKNNPKRVEKVVVKRNEAQPDQRRLHSPTITTKPVSGHTNVNYEHQPHPNPHYTGEVIQANDLGVSPVRHDDHGHHSPAHHGGPARHEEIAPGHHVITHPIRTTEDRYFNGRKN